MPSKKTKADSNTIQRAKELRRNATGPERVLWNALRSRQVAHLKFRRQHVIEPFIVDFYCATAKLVIELDGESHEGRQDYDAARQRYIEEQGFEVVRYTNDDVLGNLDGVLEAIVKAVRTKKAPPLTPPHNVAG